MEKPNILFFFSDQQRWDTIGCYGQTLPVTPCLDQLAHKGVRFEHAFTCQPVCGPARSCLQTGLYATQVGCYRNNIALPVGQPTLATYLRTAGYQTAYVGKWHLASTGGKSNIPLEADADYSQSAVPLERRGDYEWWMASDVLEQTSHGYGGYVFDGMGNKRTFDGYRVDAITNYALDFLQKRDRNRPFFLFLSHIEPHHQNDHGCFEGPLGSKERFANFVPPQDLERAQEDWGADWREQYPDYLGCCNSLDKNMDRLIKELEQQGIVDNTIIIYTSDHGSHFKTRCFEYKRSCHESSIRIPMIICGGPFQGGSVIPDLVSLIDLPPTILSAAGLTPPSSMQGTPLQNLVQKINTSWQDDIFLQISESEVGRAIRTKHYKYCVNAPEKNPWRDMASDCYVEQYLYDLTKDPYEENNLVLNPEYEEVRKGLRKRLLNRIEQAGEPIPQILPAQPPVSEHCFSLATRISKILDNPKGKSLLHTKIPGLLESKHMSILKNMTLKDLGEFMPDKFPPQLLQELQIELNAIRL